MSTEPPKRILIVRFGAIGDIVLTTPIVRALKTQLEGEVEIDFITKKGLKGLIPCTRKKPFFKILFFVIRIQKKPKVY